MLVSAALIKVQGRYTNFFLFFLFSITFRHPDYNLFTQVFFNLFISFSYKFYDSATRQISGSHVILFN